jgi:hypothetical protein
VDVIKHKENATSMEHSRLLEEIRMANKEKHAIGEKLAEIQNDNAKLNLALTKCET